MRRYGRYAWLVFVCSGAFAALVRLDAYPPRWHTFRGFHHEPSSVDGVTAHWARDYSRIEIPDNNWRPARVRIWLRAPDEAPPEGVRVILFIERGPRLPLRADRTWKSYELAVARRSPTPGLMNLIVRSETFGHDERGVGVGDIDVVPGFGWRSVGLAAAVSLAIGWLFWLGSRPVQLAIAIVLAGSLVVARTGYALMDSLPYATLYTPFHVAAIVAMLHLPGWFLLTMVRNRRATPLIDEHGALLSVAVTVAALSVLFVTLQASNAPRSLFTLSFMAIYGGLGVATAMNPPTRAAAKAFIHANRHVLVLQVLVPLSALFYLSVGLEHSGQITEWRRVAHRHTHQLPIDSHLSWLASLAWIRRISPDLLFEFPWTIGDRGPLYAALHAYLSQAVDPWREYYALYVRLGVVLNGLVASAIFVWLRWLAGGSRVAWDCTILLALNPWLFVNTYYTWPKLFAAYFALAALIVLWTHARPGLGRYLAAGAFWGLSTLAHLGQALSLPVIYVLTLASNVNSARSFRHSLVWPAAVIAAQAPWIIYKRLYAPEGYGLIVMHYLDNRGFDRPLAENVQAFFAGHPLAQQLEVRTNNVLELWWYGIDWSLVSRFWSGRLAGHELFASEFFVPLYSAGLLWLPWIAVGVAAAGIARFRRRPDGSTAAHPNPPDVSPQHRGRVLAMAALFAVLSLSLNQFLRWLPPRSHELPYLETLILASAAVYLVRRRCLACWVITLLAVAIRQYSYFTESARTSPFHLPGFDANGFLFWVICAALVAYRFAVHDAPPSSDGLAPANAVREA